MKKIIASILVSALMLTLASCCGAPSAEEVTGGKLDLSSSDSSKSEEETKKATEKATEKKEKNTEKATEKSDKKNESSNSSKTDKSSSPSSKTESNTNDNQQIEQPQQQIEQPQQQIEQPQQQIEQPQQQQQQQVQQQPQQQQPQQQQQQNTSSRNIQMGTFTGEDIEFKYNNSYIKPNDTMSSVKQKIGNANNVATLPSCIGVGNDYVYRYNGFEIESYPSSSGERVLHIYITDSSISTEKGVKVGMKTADIVKAYGSDCISDDYSYSYLASGNMHLDFIIENGTIIEIDYIYDVM